MRIAEVAEFYSPTGGGVRSYIDRKFEAAAEAGHELFVIAPAAEDRFEPRPGGGLIYVRAPQIPMDANYHMFWRAEPVHQRLDALKPDLVEASSPWRGAWIAANWRSPTPRSLFIHADPVASYPQRWLAPVASRDQVDRLFAWFWAYLRRLTGRFDSVVAGGGWLARRFEGQGVDRVHSIPLGIDRRVFTPDLRDRRLRAQLLEACGLPEHGALLLGVGRFHPEKRWPMVIAATAAARTQMPLGLVLVGDGLDRERVRQAAARAPHVCVMPPIHDRTRLATLLASGDALVHGCESETFGLVAAEALASGLPLVAPDRGGCAALADPTVSETYLSGDAQSAASAILRLFQRDGAGLRDASLAAAERARSDSQHFDELFHHYARIAGVRRPVATTPPLHWVAPQLEPVVTEPVEAA